MKQDFIITKFSIVPATEGENLTPEKAREILSELFYIPANEKVMRLPLLHNTAILIYCVPEKLIHNTVVAKGTPLVYNMINSLQYIQDHNKLIINITKEQRLGNLLLLHIVLQEGDKFILANTHNAPDFNTVLYYLLLSIKNVQLNPNQTKVYLYSTDIEKSEQLLLKQYFKGIEKI